MPFHKNTLLKVSLKGVKLMIENSVMAQNSVTNYFHEMWIIWSNQLNYWQNNFHFVRVGNTENYNLKKEQFVGNWHIRVMSRGILQIDNSLKCNGRNCGQGILSARETKFFKLYFLMSSIVYFSFRKMRLRGH